MPNDSISYLEDMIFELSEEIEKRIVVLICESTSSVIVGCEVGVVLKLWWFRAMMVMTLFL